MDPAPDPCLVRGASFNREKKVISKHADQTSDALGVVISKFSKDADASSVLFDDRRPISVSPDLATPASPLTPVFPLEAEKTEVVLYAGTPGELRARWVLHRNDLERARGGFPRAEGAALPVLRLRRLDGDGDGASELSDERRLRLPGAGGSDETGFRVGQDHARFEAELGLVNEAGGWVLLSRSNRLDHAAGIGLAFPSAPDATLARWRPDPTLDPPPFELGPEFPMGAVVDGASPAPSREDWSRPGEFAVARAPLIAQTAYRRESNGRAVPEPDTADGGGRGGRLASLTGAGQAETTKPLDARARPVVTGIPTLVYGGQIPAGTDLVVEAELRIHGWATPNTEIDLFGQRYRVGPGGRFQFALKIDDPALLRQALALHPPPELAVPRDDQP